MAGERWTLTLVAALAALLVAVGGAGAEEPGSRDEQAVVEAERTIAALSAAVRAAYDSPDAVRQVIDHDAFAEAPGWYLTEAWQVRLGRLQERLYTVGGWRASVLSMALERLRGRLASDPFVGDVGPRSEALAALRLDLLEEARAETARLREDLARQAEAERLDPAQREHAERLVRLVRDQVTRLRASISTDLAAMGRGAEPTTVTRGSGGLLGSMGSAWRLVPGHADPLLTVAKEAMEVLHGMGQGSAAVRSRRAVDYVQDRVLGRLAWDPLEPSEASSHEALFELRDELVPRALRQLDAALELLARAPVRTAAQAAGDGAVGLLGAAVQP